MANSEKELKRPREREANWGTAEKEFLRECINNHLDVIENKGNDTSMISKKKNSWKAIRAAMLSAGYDRDITKIKSQWVRMKVSARKAVTSMKRATIATGNSVLIPDISAEDSLISGMIIHEFEEDEILIDSNCVEDLKVDEFLHCDLEINESNSEEEFFISADKMPANATQQCPVKDIQITKKKSLPSKIQRLRNLPKAPSKNSVILERQRQIGKESLYSEQINKLRKKQLNEEIEHQQRMHKMQEEQLKELHYLKMQQLQRQIDHDEELHTVKLGLLCEKSSQST